MLKTRLGEGPQRAKAERRHTCGCEKNGHKGKAPGTAAPAGATREEVTGHQCWGERPLWSLSQKEPPPLAPVQVGESVSRCARLPAPASARARSLRPLHRRTRCGEEQIGLGRNQGIPGQGSSGPRLPASRPGYLELQGRARRDPGPSTCPSPGRPNRAVPPGQRAVAARTAAGLR